MKKIRLIAVFTLCICLVCQSVFYATYGVTLKIGNSNDSKTVQENVSEDSQNTTEVEELNENNKEQNNKEEVIKPSTTPDRSSSALSSQNSTSKESMSNQEFLLSCDYKIVTSTNARIMYNENYSFKFLNNGTYLRYLRHTDDTLEAEVFIDGAIKKAWVPTHNVVLAATIIKDSNCNISIVNENDPDKDLKVKSAKVLMSPGSNPLINKQRIKNVNTLLFDSNKYNYAGFAMEKDTTRSEKSGRIKNVGSMKSNKKVTLSIGSKNKTNSKEDINDKEDVDDTDSKPTIISGKNSGKITIPLSPKNNSINESNSKASTTSKSSDKMIDATINANTALYLKGIISSEQIADISEGDSVKVYEIGYAFSRVNFNELEGYVPTNALNFEDGNDYAVVINKRGKANIYSDSELKNKLNSISVGTVLRVVKKMDSAHLIHFNGSDVYISPNDLQYITIPASIEREAVIVSQNQSSKINTRISDKNGSAIVEKVGVGEHVSLISTDEKWANISTPNGKYAFVQVDFIQEN